MNIGVWLAWIIVGLDLAAGIGYLIGQDVRHAVFWLASAVVVTSITV